MSHTHWDERHAHQRALGRLFGFEPPVCPYPTKAACNKAFAAWEDDKYVALAAKADPKWHKDRHKDANMYTQVVQVLSGTGEREDITNEGGMPNMSPMAKRLRAAIERYRAANADGAAEVH